MAAKREAAAISRQTIVTKVPASFDPAWLYRILIVAMIGMVGWIGNGLNAGQDQIRDQINSLRGDLQGEVGSRNTALATISAQMGNNTGRIDMMADRVNRHGDAISTLANRVTILETRLANKTADAQ